MGLTGGFLCVKMIGHCAWEKAHKSYFNSVQMLCNPCRLWAVALFAYDFILIWREEGYGVGWRGIQNQIIESIILDY